MSLFSDAQAAWWILSTLASKPRLARDLPCDARKVLLDAWSFNLTHTTLRGNHYSFVKKTSRSHVIIDIQTVLSVLVHAGILPGARARKHTIHDYGALITDVMPVAPLLFSPAIHHCAAMHYICSSKIDVKIMTTDENQERLLSKSQIGGCLFRI